MRFQPDAIAATAKSPIATETWTAELTQQQMLFWVGQQMYRDEPMYNMATAYIVHGPLDPAAAARATQVLLNSFDLLRIVIRDDGGTPVQTARAPFPWDVETVDLSAETDPWKSLDAWLLARSRIPFDLRKRLFDFAFLKVTDSDFVRFRNVHHIVEDAWSSVVLQRQFEKLYLAALEGPLPDRVEVASLQDFIGYERAYRESSQFAIDEAYWKGKLHGIEPVSFYGKTASARSARAERVQCLLGADRTRRLKALAADPPIFVKSLPATLQNVFAALLVAYAHRVSGQSRLSVGASFHNRSPEMMDQVGVYMKILPLQAEIEEQETFVSLIRKLGQEARDGLPHRRYAVPNPEHARAYDVALNYHIMAFRDFAGMPMTHRWIHPGFDHTSLTLQVLDDRDGFRLEIDMRHDAFSEEERRRVPAHFLQVIDAFVARPEAPLHDVVVLTSEERERILVEWNQTEAALEGPFDLAACFERQAARTPDAPAAGFEDAWLTYRELDARANRLAHHLQAQGVGPGFLVGLCVERGLDMVVGLLGILKAGGAYVPMDPDFPRERLGIMIEEGRVPVMVTQERLLGRLPPRDLRTVLLDADGTALARRPISVPARVTSGDDLAYVIFTSGSTGRPKGVQIPHRAVVNFLESMRREPGLAPSDILLAVTTLSFDIAALEIFLPLVTGARVVVASREAASDGRLLVRLLESSRASVMQATPATWRMLLDAGWSGSPDLTVLCGGEALPRDLAERLLPKCRVLWNMYGPTETTIWSSVQRVRSGPGSVSIGRPISNTQMYVLDDASRPVPVGLPGELMIGGQGVARGYLGRPDLTEEKFVADPFRPGSRMYRTGDVARFNPDGTLEMLGRTDHQVKIRGYRVECGEVEAMLARYEGVRQTVVVARDDPSGEKRLVAYVVPQTGVSLKAPDLQGFVRGRLPGFMVPSAVIVLDALPLTPNGKVDRKALPAADLADLVASRPHVSPRSPVEEALATIWKEVLAIPQVGVTDSFMDLGGHSLLATQVMARTTEVFGVTVSLAAFFDTPTVEALAAAITLLEDSPGGMTEAARLFNEVSSMSAEEVAALLEEKTAP